MSTTVESRVVEMRFDNRQFEQNVSNTMSTLDKLKAKLNFSGSAKGLNDVNAAAKNVDMNGLARGVETVSARFSALQVMGVTALANITNSAVNAGKRIASALTIEPVRSGFQEYETQINAVQTILANTSSKGTTIDDVNAALQELNEYADKTIYNFTEMTRNIGTFTAAGVDLDASVSAIQGIANLAAVSGSTSQQASTAMYQLSQALATGTVRLQDWNSVVNAGMGGEVFQNALVRTAAVMAGASDNVEAWRQANIDSFGSFRDSLTQGGWLTTEVLTETLNQFTMAADEGSKEWEKYKKSLMDTGYTEKQAEEILKMANTATDAATKVKTFTQLWDVLKESAQSGWSQTWKLLIGDFEEAKGVLTPLADFFTNLINRMSDFRNSILEGALGMGFKKIGDTIESVAKPAQKAVETISDLGNIVDDVIIGKFGNGKERYDALTEAGINYYKVQNQVNEKLGDAFRYTDEQIAAQDKLLGSQQKANDAKKKSVKIQADLTEKQMADLGNTKEQVAAYNELAAAADKLGMPLDEFIKKMDEIDGRWLMIESIKNAGKGLMEVFRAMGSAWKEVFPPKSIEERSEQLFNIIATMYKFSRSLVGVIYDGDKLTATGDKLVRTFKGVFAVVDIISTVIGGAFKVAFNVVTGLLERFDLNILDVTAAIGDAIVGFRDWIDSIVNVSDVVDALVPVIKAIAEHVKIFVEAFKGSDELQSFVDRIAKMGTAIKEWLSSLKGSDNIPRDIIAGLAKGIREGAPEVIAAVFDLAKAIVEGICAALGIHSPSTVMIAIGGFIVAGLILGLKNGVDGIWPAIQDIGKRIVDWFTELDLGTVIGVAISVAMFTVFKKIADAMNILAAPFEGLGEMFESIGGAFDGLKSKLKAAAWEKRARAVLTFALAIGVMAASVYVLSTLDTGKLWGAIGAITALAAVIAILSLTIGKFGSTDGLEVTKFSTALLGISASLLLVAYALKMLSGIDTDAMVTGIMGLTYVVIAMVGLIAATSLVGKNIDKIGSTLIKMSLAMLLMIGVTKLASQLDAATAIKGGAAILAFGGIMVGLVAMTKLFNKDADKVGSTLIKMSISMLLLIGVIKLASNIDGETALKGGAAILGFMGIFAGLTAITKLFGKDVQKLGSTLMGMASAMLVMALVVKILASMTVADIIKGSIAVVAFAGIIVGLVAATRLAGDGELKRIGATLMSMSICIGVLGLVATLLGTLSVEQLAKGVTAVAILGLVVSTLIKSTRGVENCVGILVVITVAIGLLAASVAALSLIDAERLMTSSVALSLVLGMFALIVKSSSVAKGSIATLIIMVAAVTILAGVLYLLANLPVEATLNTAMSLSMVLLSITAMCAVMSLIPAAAALQGALGLAAFIGVMTGVLAALGGLAQIPGFNELIADGGQTLSAIGYAIGDFVGSIVGGFGAGLSSGLPEIGKNLSDFMENVQPFIEGLKSLDTSMLAGVGVLTAAIIALTAADLINGIASFYTGGEGSLARLGAELSAFMGNAMPFVMGASMLNADMMTGVKALAEAILILTGANIIDGLARFITGGTTLTDFGAQLPALAADMNAFATNLGSFDESKVTTVKCAADAIKTLAQAAEQIPNEGGWAAKIFGDNSIATFGAKLPLLAHQINAFAYNLGSFDDNKVATVKCAANAIKVLAESASALPNEGGIWGKIFGENSLAAFGSQLPMLGYNLNSFASNLGTFDDSTVATVTCAANAIKEMSKAASGIDGQADWAKKLFGDNSLASFGSQLGSLGSNLSAFASNLGTFSEPQVATVNSAVRAIKAFAQLADADLKGAKKNLEGFGNKLGGFGSDLSSFITDMPAASSVDSAVASIRNILSTIEEIAAANTGALGELADNLKKVGGDAVNKFVTAFTSNTAKTNVKNAADALADKAVDGLDGLDDDAESAGKDLGKGLVRGIEAKYQAAYNAGYALGQKAVQGEKDGQASNSPSKLTIQAGKWLGEGLVIGIEKMSKAVYSSGSKLGNAATNSISSTVSRIADMVSTDIDAQPTIRPVLDLSNVRTGAGAISSILGSGYSMGVLANASAVGATMNRNRVYSTNDDVVHAIGQLRKDLGNVGNTTYSINGITYDDGSNVSDAIKSITRYAIMERRS